MKKSEMKNHTVNPEKKKPKGNGKERETGGKLSNRREKR